MVVRSGKAERSQTEMDEAARLAWGTPQKVHLVWRDKDALLYILPHWYGAMSSGELLRVFGLGTHFRECVRLVNRVPVYLLERPPSVDMLPDVAQAVEKHILCERQPAMA